MQLITHNLLTLKCLAAKKSAQVISQGKKEMRKGRMFAMAERAGERKGKSVGCRVVGLTAEIGQAPGPALLLTVMLA